MMKTLALTLCALVLAAGTVSFALAQDSSTKPAPAAAPSATPSNPATDAAPKAPEVKPPDVKAPDTKVDVDIKARSDKSDDAGAASPRSGEVHRTGFFGLSPTAAIIVSVEV